MNATTLPRTISTRFTHRGTDYMILAIRMDKASPEFTLSVYAPCSGPGGEYGSLTTFEGQSHDRGQWWGKVGTRRDLPAEIEALPTGHARSTAVVDFYANQQGLALCVLTAAVDARHLPVLLDDIRTRIGSYSMFAATAY